MVFGLIAFGTLNAAAPVAQASAATSTLGTAGTAGVFGSVADFGAALFGRYLLAFEVTAFVLMVAVVGVILLASEAAPAGTRGTHKRRPGRREPIVKKQQAPR
jgi:NADH:ubiquinone oxidoreductase subunit 6 (subunit J)